MKNTKQRSNPKKTVAKSSKAKSPPVVTPLTQTAKERMALKKLTESKKPLAEVGCGLAPAELKIYGNIDWNSVGLLGHVMAMQFNDSLDWVPQSGYLSPAHLVGYVSRAFKWYLWMCGMLEAMPEVRCDRYLLPAWLSAIFRSHAPFVDGGVKLTVDVQEFTGEPESLLEGGAISNVITPQVVMDANGPEPLFGTGGAILLDDTSFDNDIIEKISSLKHTALLKDMPTKTKESSVYRDSSNFFSCGYIVPGRLSMFRFTQNYFYGKAASSYLSPLGYFRFVCSLVQGEVRFLPESKVPKYAKSLPELFLNMRLDPNSCTLNSRQVNMAYFNLVLADFMVVLQQGDPNNFWPRWKNLMIYWQAYYLSFMPAFLRFITVTGSPAWKNTNHRNALVTPQIAMLQKGGVYVEDGSLFLSYCNPAQLVSLEYFTNASGATLAFTEYESDAGSINEVYFSGSANFFGAVDLPSRPAERSWNVLPLGVYDNIFSAITYVPYSLKIVKPRLHKCLCMSRIVESIDSRTVGNAEIKYRTSQSLHCNSKMLTETCCWMNAGCMIQKNHPIWSRYVLPTSDRANRIHDMSVACKLNNVTQIAVGQSRNVADAFIGVVRDQLFPSVGGESTVFNKNAFKKMVVDYFANDPTAPPAPSTEQIQSVLTGSAPLGTALMIIGGAAAHYGPAIWNTFQQIRAVVTPIIRRDEI